MNRNNADASQYLSRLILKSPELNATPSATAEDEAIISSILEEEDLCLWDTALAHRAAGRSFELGGILYVSPPASVFVVDDCRKQVDPADDIDSRIDLMMMDADAVVILPTELPRKTPEHPSNIASRDADRQQRFREVLDRRRRVILVRTVPARVPAAPVAACAEVLCRPINFSNRQTMPRKRPISKGELICVR